MWPVTTSDGLGSLRAALLYSFGAVPRVGHATLPRRGPGQTLVAVAAAALNPADLMMAHGYYPGGLPALPFVVGLEGAGRVLESDLYTAGARVWWQAPGAAATHALVPDERTVLLPDEAEFAAVAGLGIAGMAALVPLEQLARVQAGESVLVLGATGSVGRLAVQIARQLGAGRIVAAGRDAVALAAIRLLGADDVVVLGDGTDWRTTLAEAGGPEGFDVVLDPVWGPAAAAAAGAMAPDGRLVTVGIKGGIKATLGTEILGRGLTVVGFDSYRASPQTWTAAVAELVGLHVQGKLTLPIETLPLDAIGAAWAQLSGTPRRKLVLEP